MPTLDWLTRGRFLEPEWLAAIWLAPAVAALVLLAGWMRRRAIRRLVGRDLMPGLADPPRTWRYFSKAVLLGGAVALLSIALARPQWDAETRTVERSGRDVVFIVDVSRSMLATDLSPNRLERAKTWIRDAIQAADGDRVALIAFAGGSVVKCPLTLDYGFFAQALERLDTDAVARGGTMIGDAVRKALNEVFDATEGRFRDIVLITDGEDQGSLPLEAAAHARREGVRIIALGIGSETEGATIPVRDDAGDEEDLRYNGRVVRSRLDRDALRDIALASEKGVYLHVGTGNIDLDEVYESLIARASGSAVEAEEVTEYEEKYQYFLGGAIALLLLEGLLGGFGRRRRA